MSKFGPWVRRVVSWPLRRTAQLVLPRNPWLRVLVFALPVLLLLALFRPALEVLLRLLDFGLRVLEPLLQTTLGRVLVLLVAFTLGGLAMYGLLRGRVRDLRANAVLGRHLLAVADLVGFDPDGSRQRFRRVARHRGPVPPRYPHVVADSNLKLARLALQQGRAEEAMGWLARVVEPGLPAELQRSLAQLRIRAFRLQGELLPAALEAAVRDAVDRFPSDYVLQGELRDLLAAQGDPHQLAAQQQRVVDHAPPAEAARERQRLVTALAASGQAHLAAGRFEDCRRVARRLETVDPAGPAAGLLLGDLHRRGGDLRQAIRAYGATRSPAGLDRIAELLGAHPGAVEERELLECCPLQGTLLLVARELARRGETARAESAARKAAEVLGPTPTVCAVLAEVLQLLGQDEQARLLREQAIVRLLQFPAGGGGMVPEAGLEPARP
ncbi:MAG: hypothetical protein KF830_13555 [Planctomycetes bacterium]|nr:hypothetical protein [Planctomycetota bacterium]